MKKAIVIALLSSVLIACGGGGATVNSVTQGQELLDLKKALDQGVITQEEYNDTKEKIMDRY